MQKIKRTAKQRVATYGLIVNNKQQVLIVKRAAHDTHPNMWELPGGTVDFGEDPNASVVREVEEETGLKVVMLKPVQIISHDSPVGNHVIRIVYLCKLKNDNQKVKLSHEHSAYKWITLDNQHEIKASSFLKQIFENLKDI